MRGKKTPTAIKKLKGTFRADESLANEMEVPNAEVIETPNGLCNEFATSEWMKQTKILSSIGMLAETDTSRNDSTKT